MIWLLAIKLFDPLTPVVVAFPKLPVNAIPADNELPVTEPISIVLFRILLKSALAVKITPIP